jgi:hypothetical protein
MDPEYVDGFNESMFYIEAYDRGDIDRIHGSTVEFAKGQLNLAIRSSNGETGLYEGTDQEITGIIDAYSYYLKTGELTRMRLNYG